MFSQIKEYDTLFLDRDGVLNLKIENGYVLNIADIEILPGVRNLLAFASTIFKNIIVVTNQRCIGRNMITAAGVNVINDKINEWTGSYINDFFVCPHLEEDNCNCRKPKTGLFLNASEKYAVNFSNSWLIGDSITDLIPAKQLKIKTVFVSTTDSPLADKWVRSTKELVDVFADDKQN